MYKYVVKLYFMRVTSVYERLRDNAKSFHGQHVQRAILKFMKNQL